jgi:hypothetical protein
MEATPIQISQSTHQDPLPLLEAALSQKIKLNLRYLPSGEVSIESEGINQGQSKEFTDFLLAINADNILRQRAAQQVCKDSRELFSHLLAFIICSGITLLGIYTIGKVFQPKTQTTSLTNLLANYGNLHQWQKSDNS